MIRDRLAAEQEYDADYYFEMPVELAESVTGYRHDATAPALTGTQFEVFVSRSSSRVVLRLFLGLILLVLGPLGYLRGLATLRGTLIENTDARRKPQLGAGLWKIVLATVCLGGWIGTSFGLFRLVWAFHVWLYPGHQLHDFWGAGISFRSFVPSFLMVFAPVPGAMAFGFLLGNLLAWTRAPKSAAGDFGGAVRGLFKFGFWTLSAGTVAALLAASLLKSLR